MKTHLPVILALPLTFLCSYAQPSGYTQSVMFTIDHTRVANTDQSNFPVMIVGASPSLKSAANGGQMQSANGYDILFTSDSAGSNPLPYERELHNTASGRVVYWVQVPTLSHTADTPIYIWYGNPNITTDQSTPASVWDSNYKAVWHLDDNAANTTVVDSSSNQHNGTNQANTTLRSVTGRIPNVTALSYTGTADRTDVKSVAGGDFDFTSGDFTFDFWLLVNNYVVYGEYFGNGTYPKNGYYLQEDGGNHSLQFVADTGRATTFDDLVPGIAGVWEHVAIVRQGVNLTIFVNGKVTKAFTNFVNPASAPSPFSLGGSGGTSPHGFQGALQEFRVSSIARSADWIATEYANQTDPGTFFSQVPWNINSALPPACSAGVSQVFRVGSTGVLDGSHSSARDGQSFLSYSWTEIPSAAAGVPEQKVLLLDRFGPHPKISRFVPGPVNIQLTVTQTDGQNATCVVNNGAVKTDQNGIVLVSTGSSHFDDAVYNLLGPMVPLGKNPWPFYDTAAQADAAVQMAHMDAVYGDFWDTPGAGTISVTAGSRAVVGTGTTFTTTFCQGPANPTVPIAGIGLIVWYPTNDGTGRFGRRLAGYFNGPGGAYVQSCTDDTHMTLATNAWYASEAACPTGQAAPCPLQYSVWGNWPSANVWAFGSAPANYYDVASAYYALYFRSGLDAYLINARKLADRFWSSPEFDLGNAFDPNYPLFGFQPQFRCWSIQGMVLRALDTADGHPDMWAGLHKIWDEMGTTYWLGNGKFPSTPFQNMIDQREWGYGLAQLAHCALYDTSTQYQRICRNYIKNSFATSGPGALNIWPSRQDPSGGWLTWYSSKVSAINQVNLSNGSNVVSCANSGCNWAASDFPAAPQVNVWFFNGGTLPANNSQGDPDTYCYQPGSRAACTFVDSTHFMLDRPYDGANCTPSCTRGWAFGLAGAGPVGWGAEPFFEGILAFAFDLAGRAMACTSDNEPIGCDNPTSAAAYQANSDAVNWMMKYGYRTATDGMYYYAGFMGCSPPISEQNVWCTNGNGLTSREFAGDGLRGMMVYYQRTGDVNARTMIDALYSGLWSKPGTNALVPSPDGTYDSNFDTSGYWLAAGATPNKLFGQMFGFGSHYMWPAIRLGGPLSQRQ